MARRRVFRIIRISFFAEITDCRPIRQPSSRMMAGSLQIEVFGMFNHTPRPSITSLPILMYFDLDRSNSHE